MITTVIYKGDKFIRQVDMLGDVEKVRWFDTLDETSESEIFQQENLDALEEAYEKRCISAMVPSLFFI